MLCCAAPVIASPLPVPDWRIREEYRRTHILIVDDSDDDREMFAHFLSRQGYRASKARDGRDGLHKAIELQPQLILLDLWLPIISGWDVMQHLKTDERTLHIPVLVITAHSSIQPWDCDGFLLKPCPLDQLAGEIARVLAGPRQKEM
jgi:CheY-like chemotaxis protein